MSNNIEVFSAVHGIGPRSGELLQLGTDLGRGRVSQEAYNQQFAQEAEAWLALQATAGIDIPEGGKFGWQDHLRPIVKATEGFAPDIDNAELTRWPKTNRFYRKPIIEGRLAFDGEVFEETIGKPGQTISLLSPRTFAGLCSNQYSRNSTIGNVSQLYGQLLDYFEQAGVERVVFEYYGNGVDDEPYRLHSHTVHHLAKVHPALNITDILPDSTEILPIQSKSDTRGSRVNADESNREIWQLPIDAATSAVDGLQVQDYLDDNQLQSLRSYNPASIVLSHTFEFDGHLPLVHAQEKVKKLAEFATKLNEFLKEEL